MRLRSGEKHHLRKSADRKAQISPVGGTNPFLICAFRSADFRRWCLSPERNLTHNLFFYFHSIVFGINLIHFFRWKEGRCCRKFDRLFRCFDPLSRHLTEAKRRMRTVPKSATFLATESVNSAPFKKEERCANFWQGKCKTLRESSPILRCKFLARKSAKLIANFSATKVTSLPSISLSLSLCISLSLTKRTSRTI